MVGFDRCMIDTYVINKIRDLNKRLDKNLRKTRTLDPKSPLYHHLWMENEEMIQEGLGLICKT